MGKMKVFLFWIVILCAQLIVVIQFNATALRQAQGPQLIS